MIDDQVQKQCVIVLPLDVVRRFDQHALSRHTSLSEFVRRAVESHLETEERSCRALAGYAYLLLC